MKDYKKISSWHVGVSAEAYAAALLARCGYDVSVQYGANQPEYDLIAVSGDKLLKISVKGSQDGGWGLTQGFKKNCDYHQAVERWLNAHHKKTVFCLLQFKNTEIDELPRVYFATPEEILDFCGIDLDSISKTDYDVSFNCAGWIGYIYRQLY